MSLPFFIDFSFASLLGGASHKAIGGTKQGWTNRRSPVKPAESESSGGVEENCGGKVATR